MSNEEQENFNEYFDPERYNFQSPEMLEQFGQNFDALSAIQQNDRLNSAESYGVGPFGPHTLHV